MVYRQSARSQAVRGASRQRLLDATIRLLRDKGYDAMTMQDVVAEAGSSIGNAYFYFGNKDKLVAEAVGAELDAMLAASARAAASVPAGPRRLARLIANNFAAVMSPRRGIAHILLA